MPNTAATSSRHEGLPPAPVHKRYGVIGPLDLMDTSPYEFYQSAPPGVIFAAISIGLKDFSDAGAQAAFEGVQRCIKELESRNVDVIILNGIPLLMFLGDDQIAEFKRQAAAVAPLGGWTGIDAAVAALRSLEMTNVAVANKWSDSMNERLASIFNDKGIQVAGVARESLSAKDVKGNYEEGSQLAIRLTEEAHSTAPQADGVFLGGGAWLTLHLVEDLEERIGAPVVTGLQSTNWFALNLLEAFQALPSRGKLFRTHLQRESLAGL